MRGGRSQARLPRPPSDLWAALREEQGGWMIECDWAGGCDAGGSECVRKIWDKVTEGQNMAVEAVCSVPAHTEATCHRKRHIWSNPSLDASIYTFGLLERVVNPPLHIDTGDTHLLSSCACAHTHSNCAHPLSRPDCLPTPGHTYTPPCTLPKCARERRTPPTPPSSPCPPLSHMTT
jgi:hypothetical protein